MASKFDYETFFGTSLEMLCIANAEGYFVDLNPRWAEILGYTTEELKSKPFIEFVHPDDREGTRAEAGKLASADYQTVNFQNRYLDKHGNYHWLQWSATLQGEYIYAAARDVTELVDQSQFFRETQEASLIGYWRLDLHNMQPFWSDFTYDIHEVPRGEDIDLENAINFYAPEARDEVKEMVQECIENETPWDRTLPFITAKGNHIWVRTIGRVLKSNDKVAALYGTFQDVTKQKEVSANLEKAYKDLKFHQEKLIGASRMAAIGEMAGGIAHEINNPLAILKGSCMKMRTVFDREKINSEHLAGSIEVMDNTVDRISKIVNALRFFSHEGSHIDFIPIDPLDMLQDSLYLCEEKFRNNSVVLNKSLTEHLKIVCNPVQICQVIVNLLNNAFYAVQSRDEKVINIEVKESHDKGSVLISVQDSGPGVPEEVRARIFEPFFTTKPLGEGTGMGLGISMGIAKAHSGSLTLKTGTPTTFVLELPKHQKNA